MEKKYSPRPNRKQVVLMVAAFVLAVFAFSAVSLFVGIRTGYFRLWAEQQYFGRISELHANSLIITNQDGREREVLITEGTQIRKGRQMIEKDLLVVGKHVIVVGPTNEMKQIEAKVIRIFADE